MPRNVIARASVRALAIAITLALAIGASALLPLAPTSRAQQDINVLSDTTTNNFPAGVTFNITFTAPSAPGEVRLSYEVAPDGTGATAIATCTGASTISCAYTLTSGRGIFVIPGAEITYHWEIEDAAGDRTSTEDRLYVQEDPRFTFRQLAGSNVTVYYQDGLDDAAPGVLRAAVDTLARLGQLEQTTVDFPVKVFLYATAEDMSPAIVPSGGSGVIVLGEVVYSDTAMVSADASTLDIARHEVAHIVTREATDGPFGIPGWLNEGISVFAQNQPLPGHGAALQAAIRADSVLTMPELNSSSSGGSAGTVGIYYGQAGSIVKYLVDTYGEDKFAQLLRTFKEGSRVDAAFQSVYGFDQLGLDNEWRQSVGLAPRPAAPTPTAPSGEAAGAPTPAPRPPGTATNRAGEDGGHTVAYVLIGVFALAAVGAVAYSARVIRSRL